MKRAFSVDLNSQSSLLSKRRSYSRVAPFTGAPIYDEDPICIATPVGNEYCFLKTPNNSVLGNCKNTSIIEDTPVNLGRVQHVRRALELEFERYNKYNKTITIRFPDPPLSSDIVSGLSKDITNVVFPSGVTPRVCYANLKAGADVNKIIANISKTPFGCGYLNAELKQNRNNADEFIMCGEIDPSTLHIANIPCNMGIRKIRSLFPGVRHVEINIPKSNNDVRDAFLHYNNPEEALQAFKNTLNKEVGDWKLDIHFCRLTDSMPEATSVATLKKSKKAEPNLSPIEVVVLSSSDEDNSSAISSGDENYKKVDRKITKKKQKHQKKRQSHSSEELRALKDRLAQLEVLITNGAGNCSTRIEYDNEIHATPVTKNVADDNYGFAIPAVPAKQNKKAFTKHSSGDENSRDSWSWRNLFLKKCRMTNTEFNKQKMRAQRNWDVMKQKGKTRRMCASQLVASKSNNDYAFDGALRGLNSSLASDESV